MLGLNNSGKSSILYRLKLGTHLPNLPTTIGFNNETIVFKNLKCHVWDVGGQKRFRFLWKHYTSDTQAIVWVVDTDFEESGACLQDILGDEDTDGEIPVLVLWNEKFNGVEVGREVVENALHLTNLTRPWHLQPCSAKTGQGLKQGMEWLRKQLF